MSTLLLLLFLFLFIINSSSQESSLKIENENKKENNYISKIPQIDGIYKGLYFEKLRKNISIIDNNNNVNKHGNCLIIINKVNCLEIDGYYDKLSQFKTNKTFKSIIVPSTLSSNSKLMRLSADYKRDSISFWFGIYDKYNNKIILSNYNFSYNVFKHNISFKNGTNNNNNNNNNNYNNKCPTILIMDINNINNITGNLTDCKHNISLTNLIFREREIFQYEANEYGIASLFCVLCSFYFLFKQYEYSNSLGRIVKISFITLYLQFIYNGTICFLHFDIAMNIEWLFTSFLVISFVCIINANLYQRMLKQIWSLRYPLINQQNLKLFNFIKILSFIIILFLSQYIIIGKYSCFIYFIFLSDWIFQIIHNTTTGQILSWKLNCIIFNTLTKLFYPLYIYGCPKNILQNKTNYPFCIFIIIWSIIQILILRSQDYQLNSRWFIPKKMRPNHYKYHKEPNDDDKSDNDDDDDQSDDDDETKGLTTNKQTKLKTCSICLEEINWKKEYKTIMITPCNHFFHDKCLREWMLQRLTCPTCRFTLPPPF